MHDDERELYRRHAAEGVLLLGGGAAILLQLADPRVARGVAMHSDFRDRPLDRLLGTLDYVYAVGFGDDDMVATAVRTVNARHAPVRGPADDDAPAYSAFDADAQRWVASTLLAAALGLHERLHGPLDTETADVIVRNYRLFGSRLQATHEGWAESRAEFDAWWDERIAVLQVGREARFVAHALLSGTSDLPFGSRALLPPIRLITAALLPPAIRDAYGFRWTPRASRTADAWLRAIAIVWPRLPRLVRHAPLHASLRRVKRRSRYAGLEPRGRR
ncbi:oxygenase MpaB family protein [Agromyces humatus]|uniref:ER-bound oxygenase mpaB/mpaB'/Rubber oxygenase catalytic domain-containing protein n=1 Tax=Agromyces humatus TaxID=279573 RepID=A0ABP4WL83_9MICO|nr:oxygenase MpaB family protein [Agromyces humatus]